MPSPGSVQSSYVSTTSWHFRSRSRASVQERGPVSPVETILYIVHYRAESIQVCTSYRQTWRQISESVWGVTGSSQHQWQRIKLVRFLASRLWKQLCRVNWSHCRPARNYSAPASVFMTASCVQMASFQMKLVQSVINVCSPVLGHYNQNLHRLDCNRHVVDPHLNTDIFFQSEHFPDSASNQHPNDMCGMENSKTRAN